MWKAAVGDFKKVYKDLQGQSEKQDKSSTEYETAVQNRTKHSFL
jgi:predicted acetyltransferase